jgi:hypothetical protein
VLAHLDDRPRQHLGWAKLNATKKVKEFLNAHGAAVGICLELRRGGAAVYVNPRLPKKVVVTKAPRRRRGR